MTDLAKDKMFAGALITEFGSPEEIVIRFATVSDSVGQDVGDSVRAILKGTGKFEVRKVDIVGPKIGSELREKGIISALLAMIGILIYVTVRFEWKFAIASIITLAHDISITLGAIILFDLEISLDVLAAVLTLIGYSLNDTIIIFDRIRESFRRQRKMSTQQIIDHAITSTISRTIITHGSTQIMVLSMLLFGGPTLHYFALALTIGILFGIYSSVFVAAAIAMWLGIKREDLIKGGPKKEGDPDDPNAGAVV